MSRRVWYHRALLFAAVVCLAAVGAIDSASAEDAADVDLGEDRPAESAQIGPQIGVSTLNLYLTAMPGETQTGSIQVYNLGREQEAVEILLADWDHDLTGAIRIYDPGVIGRSLSGDISIEPTSMVLNPGEVREVQYVVTVPPDCSGSRWGLIMVRSEAKVIDTADFGEGRTAVFAASKTYGIKVVQTVVSTLEPELIVAGSAVEHVRDCELPTLVIGSLVVNTGQIYVEVTGTVNIVDEFGELVGTVPINRVRVLPGHERLLSATYAGELRPGFYVAVVVVDFGGSYLVGAQVEFEIGQ